MRLKDKAAIVTGGGQGIGKGIALKFAEEGADLLLFDMNAATTQETAGEIRALGRKAVAVTGSVTRQDDVDRMVEVCLKEFGRIDILVNNAGIDRPSTLLKFSEERWDQIMEVNLKGVFRCTQAVAPKMAERRYGKIINISSDAGKTGFWGETAYCAAKSGVIGLTRVSALELAKKGINVNAICPGLIDTALSRTIPESLWQRMASEAPKGRVGTPRDIGNLAAFLASDEADFITGQSISCDGGWIMY